MNSAKLRRVIVLLLLLACVNAHGLAQDDSVVSLQAANNLGFLQPRSMDEIINTTGLRAYQNANRTGRGVRIGVLDTVFGELAELQGRMADTIFVLPEDTMADYNDDVSTHGTDVLEIIHTIAPRATLYVCRYRNYERFVRCIDWLINNGVHIINHSAGVPALPLDGSNVWAREVTRAANANILWVNAAGNFAGGYITNGAS